MNCSDARLVFAVCDMPIIDTHCCKAMIPFYVVKGDGMLLLGNEFVHHFDLLGQEELLVVPPGVLETHTVSLRTYSSGFSGDREDSIWTKRLITPCTFDTIHSYFCSLRTLPF